MFVTTIITNQINTTGSFRSMRKLVAQPFDYSSAYKHFSRIHSCSTGELEIKPDYVFVTQNEKELMNIHQHGKYIRSCFNALTIADNFSHNFVFVT